MKSKFKKIPKFSNETQERNFWQTHDSTEYVDWDLAVRGSFPNLKLSSRPITIRMPNILIDRLKIKANIQDTPYQTLIKQILYQALS